MKKDWWNKEFSIMMTMGESTTAGGWSSSRDRSWPYLLAKQINDFQRVPVQLVNLGIGANVISTKSPGYPFSGKPAADERFDEHVLAHRANGYLMLPDLLVISYGLNDARGGTPIPLFCDVMLNMINRVRAKTSALIVLPGPYFMTDFALGGPEWSHGNLSVFNDYNQAICSFASQNDCLFVDILSAYNGAEWLVHHDGVHANDLGHRVVANKIFEVLAQNCSGLAIETQFLETKIVSWRDESTLQSQWERDHYKK